MLGDVPSADHKNPGGSRYAPLQSVAVVVAAAVSELTARPARADEAKPAMLNDRFVLFVQFFICVHVVAVSDL